MLTCGGRRLGRLAAGCLAFAWLAVGALGSSWFSAGCMAFAWLAVGALGSWSPRGLFFFAATMG